MTGREGGSYTSDSQKPAQGGGQQQLSAFFNPNHDPETDNFQQ